MTNFKDRIGDVINGVVKRVEYGNVMSTSPSEAIIRRDEMIPRELFRPGDRVRAYVYDVRANSAGRKIFLSRTHPQFNVQAVPAGSAGNLRWRDRGQIGGPRPRLARQNRGHFARFVHRSGRRLRRHARLARAGRGQ